MGAASRIESLGDRKSCHDGLERVLVDIGPAVGVLAIVTCLIEIFIPSPLDCSTSYISEEIGQLVAQPRIFFAFARAQFFASRQVLRGLVIHTTTRQSFGICPYVVHETPCRGDACPVNYKPLRCNSTVAVVKGAGEMLMRGNTSVRDLGDPIANILPIEDPNKNVVVIIKDGKIYKNSLNSPILVFIWR